MALGAGQSLCRGVGARVVPALLSVRRESEAVSGGERGELDVDGERAMSREWLRGHAVRVVNGRPGEGY